MTCNTGANKFTVCSQALNATEGLPFTQAIVTFSPSTLDASPQPAQFGAAIN